MIEKIVLALWENPAGFFALVGLLALILFGLHLRRIRFTTVMLLHISLMVALAFLLHQVRLYHFPQGGSVTLGSMVPLLLLSYRYGPGIGALAGFLYGFLNLMQDPFILHPVQVLFDYPLSSMAMGLAGFLPHRVFLAAIGAFLGRFFCHFVSGVVFFSSYAPEGMSPILYSLTVNASLLLPECFICCLALKVLPLRRLLHAMGENTNQHS